MDSQFRCLCDLAIKSLLLSIRDRSCYFHCTYTGWDEVVVLVYLSKVIIIKCKLNFLCGIRWRYLYIHSPDFIVIISYAIVPRFSLEQGKS